MRVVYIYGYNARLSGVMNKVNDMLAHLRLAGAEVIPLPVCSSKPPENALPANAQPFIFNYNSSKWFSKGPLQLFTFFRKSRLFVRALEAELNRLQPDIVMMRYKTMNPFMAPLLRKYRFVLEHNTKEIEELQMMYSGIRKSGWESAAILRIEKSYTPVLLRKVAGIVCVTHEITRYELKRAGREIPSFTSGNGIDTSRIPFTPGPVFTGDTLNVMMLSSNSVSWQGTDKLIQSLKQTDQVHLWLVGNYTDEEHKMAKASQSKITFTGNLVGEELDELFSKMHVAVASLAIERKGLTEMSALKVREYAARGLPFVIAFDDPDLPEGALEAGVGWYRANVLNKLLDFSEIRNFALTATSLENRKKLRSFAEKQMNYSVKMKRLYDFLQKLISYIGQ